MNYLLFFQSKNLHNKIYKTFLNIIKHRITHKYNYLNKNRNCSKIKQKYNFFAQMTRASHYLKTYDRRKKREEH